MFRTKNVSSKATGKGKTSIATRAIIPNGKKEFEDETVRSAAAHSNFYYTPFNDLGKDVDVVLEAKMKEQALKKYIQDFLV